MADIECLKEELNNLKSKNCNETSNDISPLDKFLAEATVIRPIRALLMYLHKKIIPMYKKFEEGRNVAHVLGIIKWSSRLVNELGSKFPIDINIVYAVAAFHDTGLKFGMTNHEKNVARVIETHKKDLSVWFSETDITTIAEACLFHDSKEGKKPKNIYGIILHDASIIQDVNTKNGSDLMLPDSRKILKQKMKFMT